MSRYHVHVYNVQGMGEIDLEGDTPDIVMDRALELVKTDKLHTGNSDCSFLAMCWLSEDEKNFIKKG